MIIGIDLGTTKSIVSVWKHGKPIIIPDKSGYQTIPSLVLVTQDEQILTGNITKRHPDRYIGKNITISSIKRLMGKGGETGWGWWKTYPQEVSSHIIAELKFQAEKYLGQEISQAVIAIPSHFDESQRRATLEASKIAGLEFCRLLNEATAAVLPYGFMKKDESKEAKVLVFDFGGGTLDVSVVLIEEGVCEVLSIEGDSKLGGDDFDQIIVDSILNHINKKHTIKIELDPVKKLILKEAAERLKIELSGKANASLHIPGFIKTEQGYQDLDFSLDRKTFEEQSKDLLERAIKLIKSALNSAKLKATDLSAFLLLGGSSRIPCIKKRIIAELGVEPFTGVDPTICVAQGAAIIAAILEGKSDLHDFLLLDVIPSSYGIGMSGDAYTTIIPKNTTIPTKHTQIFSTAQDNQDTINIRIYQGEKTKASDNTYLSTLELAGIPPAPKQVPQIEVTFEIDQNMTLRVSAKDNGTGKEQSIVVKSPYGLNNTQIKIMSNKLKIWQNDRKVDNLKKEINVIICNIDRLLSNSINALSFEKISKLRETTELLNRFKKKKISFTAISKVVYNTKYLYDSALKDLHKYENIINQIELLKKEIDRLNKIIKKEDKTDESMLLVQGKDILDQYLKQNLSYDELKKIFFSVNTFFINTKTKLINEKLNILFNSDGFKKWIESIKKAVLDTTSLSDYLIELRQLKNFDLIKRLFSKDDSKNRDLIANIKSANFIDKQESINTLIIIISLCVDFNLITMIDEFPNDEPNQQLLSLAISDVLRNRGAIGHRIKAAKIVSEIFPLNSYIPKIVELICDEQDKDVKKFLLNYLHKHPKGIFHYFFISADAKTKNKILNNKELLINLVNENQESSCILALESLTKFPIDEIAPILLSYVNNNNFKIRYKSLELIMKSKIKNEIVKEKMITIMCNQKGDKVIHYLLLTLMDKNNKIHNLAKSYFNENMDDLDTIIKKLFILILKVIEKKHHLRIKDKFFLSKLLKKHPKMDDVVNSLKNIANRNRI